MNRKKGIGIIAPSLSLSAISPSLIEIGRERLESLGFLVKFGQHSKGGNSYVSGTIEERLSDIHKFLDDDDIDIIMAAFGGYNSNQLINHLDYEKIKATNKMFIGYSDVTILLNAIYSETGMPTIHGPAFVNFCNPNIMDETLQYFLKVINKQNKVAYYASNKYAYDDWYLKENYGPRDIKDHQGWQFVKEGKGTGILIGGNLESFLALAGTRYFPDTKDKIILMEDVASTTIGKFLRELTQLDQMGVLSNIKGIIIGKFGDEMEVNRQKELVAMLLNVTKDYDFPIIINTNFSHVDPIYTICIGSMVTINSNDESNIIMINNG